MAAPIMTPYRKQIDPAGLAKLGDVANAEAHLANLVTNMARIHQGVISSLVCGFVQETGLMPSECVLVCRQEAGEMLYYVEKKADRIAAAGA